MDAMPNEKALKDLFKPLNEKIEKINNLMKDFGNIEYDLGGREYYAPPIFWETLAKHPNSMIEGLADQRTALSMILSCIAKGGDARGLVEKIFNVNGGEE